MLQPPIINNFEKRPIERRGNKRASPLIETSLSYHEAIIANLLYFQNFMSSGSITFGDNLEPNINNLIISLGHLIRQTNYKRQNKL